ncbi:hypothetical protein AYO22_10294 [Fonsecaea multimorphosa]|nr:hypothetical protein AYO22_10294 [Fonsecaea multimorphosa]
MAIRESEYIDHITSLESELRKLRAEKEDLSQNLESCKDRIFNMLPVEGMADTQLQSQYTTLCKTIEYWLDNQFDDAEDFIGTLAWVGKSEDRRNLVSEYLPQRYLTLAGEDRNVQIPIMQVLVARYLHQNLLEKDRIFPGLDPSTEACLGMVIDGLHALNPAKDKDAILMWAVDLQRAFNTNERFKEQRQKKLSEIEAVIMHCPMLLKEMGLHGRSNDPVICREIVKEAADLANNIRQSMAEYAFDFRVGSAVLFEEKVKNFTVIDCGTGSTLSSSAVPIPGPDGRVGFEPSVCKEIANYTKMSKTATRPDWADDVSDSEQINDPSALPAPVTTVNKDGTRTTVFYRFNDQGQKVKVTRKTRITTHKEKVNPVVAERRTWDKFGLEKGKPKGPQPDTTSVGENILFRPSRDWKNVQAEEAKAGGGKAEEKSLKEQLRDKKVKCRICQGEHFTARCPFKDTMAPADDGTTPVADPMAEDEESGGPKAQGGLGAGGSSYVPPHLRKGAQGAGERMGGKYERDDLATLRVTNVSEMAEEQELRDLFERFGRVTRVFLAKDRDTGRAKGFAFISFVDRSDAARACEKMDGFGYRHLILRVEFAKRTT